MQNPRASIRLASIQVHWSEADAAYVARSEQFPGLTHSDRHSSLVAVDGLLDAIDRTRAAGRSGQACR